MSDHYENDTQRAVLMSTTLHHELLTGARRHADDQASSEHVLTLCALLAGTVREWLTGGRS